MKKLSIFCLALFSQFNLASYIENPNPWSKIAIPTGDSPQAIGSYSNGCQQGAQILPEQGIGYFDIRRFRNRYYSQPRTITLVKNIGKHVYQETGEAILIGDLSQPIGGLMSYAHISHQNGLDVDIYFASVPQGSVPDKDYKTPTVVNKISGSMQLNRWKPAYREALYAAATSPYTTRIFVNPIIKKYLCDTEVNSSWLHKIRPWYGHDAHFHIRLACPEDNVLCKNQSPVPAGDGCSSDINNWINDQREAILHPKSQKNEKPKSHPETPQSCRILLQRAEQKKN